MALISPNTILLELYITAYGVLKHQDMTDDLLRLLRPYIPLEKPFIVNYATWLGSGIEELAISDLENWAADKASRSEHLLEQVFG